MRKLICAALVASSMCVMAEEAATTAPVEKPAAAAGVKRGPGRAINAEQRAQMKARREKFIAERKAAMEGKLLEVIKKYGLDDEKAKALLDELQDAMRSGRRDMMRKAAAPAPAAEAPAAK